LIRHRSFDLQENPATFQQRGPGNIWISNFAD